MATENADEATKKALEFWGYLFNTDKSAKDLLNRLLTGIWNFIVREPFGTPFIPHLAFQAITADHFVTANRAQRTSLMIARTQHPLSWLPSTER
jgi:hypothetical protein